MEDHLAIGVVPANEQTIPARVNARSRMTPEKNTRPAETRERDAAEEQRDAQTTHPMMSSARSAP